MRWRRRGWPLRVWLYACVALCPRGLHAQEASGTPRESGIALPGTIELPRLVDLAAERLRIAVTYDPATLKGQLTLRIGDSVSDDQLWRFMLDALASNSWTLVRRDSAGTLYSVVRLADAAGVAAINAGEQPPRSIAGFVTAIYRVRNAPSKSVTDAIKQLVSKPAGGVTALSDNGLIAISDLSSRIPDLLKIAAEVDVPADPVVVEEFPLRVLTAGSAVTLVGQLITKQDAVVGQKTSGEIVPGPGGTSVFVVAPMRSIETWRSILRRVESGEAYQTVTYTPKKFSARDVAKLVEDAVHGVVSKTADDRWRLVVDELTGTLIITGTPAQHAQVASMMERLDSANGGPLPMRSYPVRNRPVKEMADTLSRLIEAGVLSAGAGEADRDSVRAAGEQRTTREPAAPLLSNTTPTLVPPPSVTTSYSQGQAARSPLRLTADEATNTLIAVGEPRLLSQLESLLKMLDVRQPQVMLEVMLVSLTDGDTLNLGVELDRVSGLGSATARLASLFGLSSGTPGNRVPTNAAGFTGAVLDPGEFSVIVKALENVNKGRSLSRPKVLVANNQQATFSSVLQQPFVRTDLSTTSTTSSYGGSEDAGTTISVKPQIAQGDHLVLTYNVRLSSFVGTPTSAGLPPPKQQNTVDSVATIPDGFTVVVGGLELSSESESADQIPWIGDIPLLGNLFKNQSHGKSHTRFFVFIQATVLRSSTFEDLKYLSQAPESLTGIGDGLPEVKPQVIR